MGYSFRLTARVLLYAPSHRQDSTYHSLCYTSCGALAGTRNSSMGPPHEGSIRRPIAPWWDPLWWDLHLAPTINSDGCIRGVVIEVVHNNWRWGTLKTMSNKHPDVKYLIHSMLCLIAVLSDTMLIHFILQDLNEFQISCV